MVLGFTGTQRGMTSRQRAQVILYFEQHLITQAHHGDWIGADAEFHDIALAHEVPVVLHPPLQDRKRANCKGASAELPPMFYLDRNKEIVHKADVLIACPKEYNEVLRSGIWSTIRYAAKVGKTVIIILPDGSMKTN